MQYTKVTDIWSNELLPNLESLLASDSFLSQDALNLQNQVDEFVIQVDQLVSLYQQHAEQRILLIRMIQGFSLLITIFLVVVIMIHLSRRVEKPLSELTSAARQITNGDYTAHTHVKQNDELGLLSATMNQLADAVAHSQHQLEARVKDKTYALQRSNNSLEILYEVTTLLSNPGNNLDLEPITQKLSAISGIEDLDLCLTTKTATPLINTS